MAIPDILRYIAWPFVTQHWPFVTQHRPFVTQQWGLNQK